MLNEIINYLFKYPTDNSEEKPNTNILACLESLFSLFKKKGIYCQLQEYKIDNRYTHANLIAFNPVNKGPSILFQGHIDTVPFDLQYQYKITNNVLIGRGAVDMKGPLSGMIESFVKLYKKKLDNPPALLITGDEEANGFAGIKNFIKKQTLPVLFAINGEPTDFKIGDQFLGVLGYEIEKLGIGGHSSSLSNDFLIEETVPLIQEIVKFLKLSRKIRDKKFGKTIGAFTVLNAGIKSNQLPERIKFSWNLRTVREKKYYDEIFQSTVAKEIDKNIEVKSFGFNPVTSKISQDIINKIKVAFTETNIPYNEQTVKFFTEASFLNENKIPSIVCGPGNPNLAHVCAQREEIKIDDIKKYARLLENIVLKINKNVNYF